MHIDILLSTYNGEKYLADQLNSIINQNFTGWRIIVRDDGSTDNTMGIILDFVGRYPSKLLLKTDTLGNIGYNRSFTKLLEYVNSDYIMFCDQDDYWYPDKLSLMYNTIAKVAQEDGQVPLLIFADLHIADETLIVTDDNNTLFKIRNYKDAGQQIFFLKNYVTGCNIMFNRILMEKTLQTKNLFRVHDYWFIFNCSVIGKLICLTKPLMKYRIHGENEIGIGKDAPIFIRKNIASIFSISLKNILKYAFRNKTYRNLTSQLNMAQMKELYTLFPDYFSAEAEHFLNLDQTNYLIRKYNNIFKPYIIEKLFIEQLVYIICF